MHERNYCFEMILAKHDHAILFAKNKRING